MFFIHIANIGKIIDIHKLSVLIIINIIDYLKEVGGWRVVPDFNFSEINNLRSGLNNPNFGSTASG